MNDTFRNNLAAMKAPYAAPGHNAEQLFEAAMNEADTWHKSHNPAYASLWQDGARPVIPVGVFKIADLTTPIDGPGAWLTSSGTGKSGATRVFYDSASMQRIEKAMGAIFMTNGLFSELPSRFLLLSPDPSKGEHAGYATAFLKFTGCAPVEEIVFCVDEKGRFDAGAAWATLKRWGESDKPVFIFGLTVFFEQLCLAAEESGIPAVKMAGPVRGLTGGGWKGLTKRQERAETVAGLQKAIAAPLVDIRDLYGMTEHPLHYVSCGYGNFHLPLYSRFFIVDAAGKAAEPGTPGIIRLQNPFFASLPSHDLLTEDMGSWEAACPCGTALPCLKYLGRLESPAGTCAHGASTTADSQDGKQEE